MKHIIFVALLAACGSHDNGDPGTHGSGTGDDAMSSSDGDTGSGSGSGSGSGMGSGSGSSTSISGQTISCYSQASPTATCTLPTHCCFSNFNAQHSGACDANACAWGTIECDGPEDCTNGGHCCSQALTNQDGTYGYRIACQAAPCGSGTAHEELCHPSGPACANGGSCITAFGNNNDLPRSLYICR